MKRSWSGTALLLALLVFTDAFAQESGNKISRPDSKLSYWAYDVLNIPELTGMAPYQDQGRKKSKTKTLNEPIIIAIVDDAFRLSHKDLQDFIFTHPIDRPGNGIDDDGNGKTDDFSGWDIADNDNNVFPPEGREEAYFHGTFIAGSVITLLKEAYGEDAKNLFKILPVKVLSDYEQIPYLKDGYRGIKYATEQGADIICCAWSGGELTEDERKIIAVAREAGIALIGSAGNAYSEKVDNPAALESVLAVAGLDTLLEKTEESNYGAGVELAAPARMIRAAHPLADNAYFYGAGTSGAAGLVTGSVAILKSIQPDASPEKLFEALVNTSTPFNDKNISYSGKLGAGIPDIEKAVSYLATPDSRGSFFSSERTRGTLILDKTRNFDSYEIQPEGAFRGFSFTLPEEVIKGKKTFSPKQRLAFYSGDSLFYESSLDMIPPEVFIPGSGVRIEYTDKRFLGRSAGKIFYSAVPIDSTILYCSGISRYTLPTAEITDGSGEKDYANNSACKWQITVEEGKRISIRFSEFDTEPAVDYVYLFDGESTIPGNLIAKFSGPDLPPEVTSRTNSVLVWFVTDDRNTGDGWKMTYTTSKDQ